MLIFSLQWSSGSKEFDAICNHHQGFFTGFRHPQRQKTLAVHVQCNCRLFFSPINLSQKNAPSPLFGEFKVTQHFRNHLVCVVTPCQQQPELSGYILWDFCHFYLEIVTQGLKLTKKKKKNPQTFTWTAKKNLWNLIFTSLIYPISAVSQLKRFYI